MHAHLTTLQGVLYGVPLGIVVVGLIIAFKYALRYYFGDKSKIWDWITPPEYFTRAGWYAYVQKNPKLGVNQTKVVLVAGGALSAGILWQVSRGAEIDIGILYVWSILPITLGIVSIPLWAKIKYPSLCIAAAVLYVIAAIWALFVIQDLNSQAYPLPHFACKLIGEEFCQREWFSNKTYPPR